MLIWLKNQGKVRYRTFQLRFGLAAELEKLEETHARLRAEWAKGHHVKSKKDAAMTEALERDRAEYQRRQREWWNHEKQRVAATAYREARIDAGLNPYDLNRMPKADPKTSKPVDTTPERPSVKRKNVSFSESPDGLRTPAREQARVSFADETPPRTGAAKMPGTKRNQTEPLTPPSKNPAPAFST